MVRFDVMKVGELSKRTGLTIRALHHYDEIGLLKPSLHTDSGHRLYTANDVIRLQQVLSLRQVGLSLDEVRDCLDRSDFSPLEVIQLLVRRLREQIESKRRLCERLEALSARLRTTGQFSADDFLRAIEVMTLTEKYYTAEQREYLRQRGAQLGDKRIAQAQNDWAKLMAAVRAEMAKGTAPTSRKARALARRWMSLVNEFSGGNREIEKAVTGMWKTEGSTLAAQFRIGENATGPTMQQCFEYIGKALDNQKRQCADPSRAHPLCGRRESCQ